MFASRTNAAWGKNRAAQPSTFFIVFNLFLDSLGLFRIVFQRFRIVLGWFGLWSGFDSTDWFQIVWDQVWIALFWFVPELFAECIGWWSCSNRVLDHVQIVFRSFWHCYLIDCFIFVLRFQCFLQASPSVTQVALLGFPSNGKPSSDLGVRQLCYWVFHPMENRVAASCVHGASGATGFSIQWKTE